MHQFLFLLSVILFSCGFANENWTKSDHKIKSDIDYLVYHYKPTDGELKMYLKDENGKNFRKFSNLKSSLNQKGVELIFAMNGGMFTPEYTPAGLFIENGEQLNKINRVKDAPGNFHLTPNGVFGIHSNGRFDISATEKFMNSGNLSFATQSGPMLMINGEYHPAFNKGSKNLNIRNGVGVLPNGEALFVMSKKRVNFYDFASFFKSHGCENALYLDGAISQTYILNEAEESLNRGNFGVIIGVEKALN